MINELMMDFMILVIMIILHHTNKIHVIKGLDSKISKILIAKYELKHKITKIECHWIFGAAMKVMHLKALLCFNNLSCGY